MVVPSSLGATLRSFGRQAPPLVWAGSWGVLAACPPGVGLCSFRGRGFCLPRTTAALAGPWALPIPPGAVLRGPRLGDGSVPVTIAGRIPPPCTGELDIDGRSARPWCVTPSPARLRLALSTSGACDHMTVSLREPLAGYCGLPSFYLIWAMLVNATVVCTADWWRWAKWVARAVRARSAISGESTGLPVDPRPPTGVPIYGKR